MENQVPEAPQEAPQTPPTPTPTPEPITPQQQPSQPSQLPQSATNGLAIAGMVVGIVAFLSGWVPLFGFVVAVAAVILSILGLRKGTQKGMAITGLVTGGLGLIWSLIVGVIFILGIIAGFSSYNNYKVNTDHSSDQSQTQDTQNTQKEDSMGGAAMMKEKVTAGGYEMTVNSITRDVTVAGESDANLYLAVNMTVKNVSNKSDSLRTIFFTLKDGDQKYFVKSSIELKPSLVDVPLAQGETATGNIVFTQPKGDGMLMLDYLYVENGTSKTQTFHLE